MLRLTEANGLLVLGYPAWVGLVFLVLGTALAMHLLLGKGSGKLKFGEVAAAFICAYAAWHFLAFRTTVGADGVHVYAPLHEDTRVAWGEAAGGGLEQRKKGKGGPSSFYVLQTRGGGEVAIPLDGLSYEGRAQLVAAMEARLAPRPR